MQLRKRLRIFFVPYLLHILKKVVSLQRNFKTEHIGLKLNVDRIMSNE